MDGLWDNTLAKMLATVRGVGNGASAGFVKYPAAAMMAAYGKASGDTKGTWKEEYTRALEAVRDQRDSDRDKHPIASYGGDIVGSMVPGAAAFKVLGGSARAAAGAGVALGGTTGYTENAESEGTTGRDVATGGVIGGALGAIGGGTTNIIANELARRAATKAMEQSALEGAKARLEQHWIQQATKAKAAKAANQQSLYDDLQSAKAAYGDSASGLVDRLPEVQRSGSLARALLGQANSENLEPKVSTESVMQMLDELHPGHDFSKLQQVLDLGDGAAAERLQSVRGAAEIFLEHPNRIPPTSPEALAKVKKVAKDSWVDHENTLSTMDPKRFTDGIAPETYNMIRMNAEKEQAIAARKLIERGERAPGTEFDDGYTLSQMLPRIGANALREKNEFVKNMPARDVASAAYNIMQRSNKSFGPMDVQNLMLEISKDERLAQDAFEQYGAVLQTLMRDKNMIDNWPK